MCKNCTTEANKKVHQALLDLKNPTLMYAEGSIHTIVPTDGVIVGSATTEEDGENTNERNTEGDSQNRSKDSEESEYFAPDPYDEAGQANETEFFALRRGRGL